MSAAAHPSCDRSLAQATRPHAVRAATAEDGREVPALATTPASTTPPHARGVLAATILASSLGFIDGSIVNVGLPAIGRALQADGAGLAWVVTGYLLPLTALLLTGGAAGDRFGRRRLLQAGIALFAAASLVCALAPSLAVLLAGRVLQGIGAALLTPNSLAILGASFSGEARGRAIGLWAAVGAGAGAIAPLAGGALIDAVGWRTMFVLQVPLAALAAVLAARYVADDAPGTGRCAAPDRNIDAAGGVLAGAGLAALTWGLTLAAGPSGIDTPALAGFAVGGVLVAAFVALEARRGADAMLPLALFAARPFVGLTLLTLLLYGALTGVTLLLPFLLIERAGYSATAAGATLLPLPLVIALASASMGRLAERTGPMWPLVIGPLVVAAGCLLGLRVTAQTSDWTFTLPVVLLVAVGMAVAVAPLTTAVFASVTSDHAGVASGLNSAVARGGGLVATALSSLVFASRGPALDAAFHTAAMTAAAAAVGAAICAAVWLRALQPAGAAVQSSAT